MIPRGIYEMASDTNINTILSQSHAIREIYNAKKQDSELQQQQKAQDLERKKKEDKSKVGKFDTDNKILVKGDENRKRKHELKHFEEDKKKEEEVIEEQDNSESKLIDIRI